MTAKGYGVSFRGDEMFKIDCGDSCTTLNKLKTIELYPLMVNCNYISKKERERMAPEHLLKNQRGKVIM